MMVERTAIDERVEDLLRQLTLHEKVAMLSGADAWRTVAIPRLGIPSLTVTDGPHGVRTCDQNMGRKVGPATCFPTGVAMAASWDPALIAEVGAVLAAETLAYDCDILLGPCVNIVRAPLGGRNFETYAEDPYLAGQISVSYINSIQANGVGTSLKHYAVNNYEIERFRASSEVDERTLREIYLPAFEASVKQARPWTVMCSYNRINGVYASQHEYLLNQILKGEWGFEGFVVSDWGANHTTVESVANGLDLEMPGPAKYYGPLLVDAINNWQIDLDKVDEAVRRILRVVVRSGRMDHPRPAGVVNTPEHRALARRLAEESITLLKNDAVAGQPVLPLDLSTIRSIAVIGPNASEARIGGGGSSFVIPPERISPLDGLRERLGDQVEIRYEQGGDNWVNLPILPAGWLKGPDGKSQGLLADYYHTADLAGGPDYSQPEERLEYWWWNAGSADKIESYQQSIRWQGFVQVPTPGRYTIGLECVGNARIWLDDQEILSMDMSHSPEQWKIESTTTSLVLDADRPHPIRIEYDWVKGSRQGSLKVTAALTPTREEDDRLERAVALAKQADVALLFVGMPEGFETEGTDRPHMDMPGNQNELIRAVVAANPRTIVILNAGSPVAMPWAGEVPAIVEAYYPGQEAGRAVASVLTGAVNPSGKLPVTFPHRLADTPAAINMAYPGARQVHYGEGIFVGYRWYDHNHLEPLFPFGHGLSYTQFEYGPLQVQAQGQGQPVEVSLTVRNVGQRAGAEVVQLYVHDVVAALPRPPKELKGFHKLNLQPGESQTVHFTLDERALAFYDPHRGDWVVEPGEFELLVGSSSRDIRQRATFQI